MHDVIRNVGGTDGMYNEGQRPTTGCDFHLACINAPLIRVLLRTTAGCCILVTDRNSVLFSVPKIDFFLVFVSFSVRNFLLFLLKRKYICFLKTQTLKNKMLLFSRP